MAAAAERRNLRLESPLRARAVDIAVACGLTASMQLELTFVEDPRPGATSVLAGLLMTLPLAARRAAPLVVAIVVCAALVGQELLDGRLLDGPITAPGIVPILAYSTGRLLDVRPAGAGVAIVVASLCFALSLGSETVASDLLIVPTIFAVAPWLAGRALRARERQLALLRAANRTLDAEHEQRARLDVAHERLRLARELHDVVSHGVTTMIVQAGAAEQTVTRDPDVAREALSAIQQAGERTVDELRQMLGVLRHSGEQSALSPIPGLGDVDQLVADLTRSGLEVTLERSGLPRELPAGLELSAYRIIQESLTNALKHARATRVSVTLDCAPRMLTIEVTDDGGHTERGGGEAGHGILGMRERVAVLGGELDAGHRPDGGFGVQARIPLPRAAARR